MAETTATPPAGASREVEEAAFYNEAALNATWTGSRLALGALSFLFGAFLFAYFYLRSVNSRGRWHGSGFHPPSILMGTIIMFLVVLSAGLQYAGLQRIKAGDKRMWQIGAVVALVLGLGAGGAPDHRADVPPVLAGQLGLFQRIRRFQPRVRGHAADGDGLAGDTARQVTVHPGDLLRRAAAYLGGGGWAAALPGVAVRLHHRVELPRGGGSTVLGVVLRDLTRLS